MEYPINEPATTSLLVKRRTHYALTSIVADILSTIDISNCLNSVFFLLVIYTRTLKSVILRRFVEKIVIDS